MKLQERNKQFTVTIPRVLALALNWKVGDTLIFDVGNDQELILRRKK